MKAKKRQHIDMAIQTLLSLEQSLKGTPDHFDNKENLCQFLQQFSAINEVDKYYLKILEKVLCAQAFQDRDKDTNMFFIDAQYRIKDLVNLAYLVNLTDKPTSSDDEKDVSELPMICKLMEIFEGNGCEQNPKFTKRLFAWYNEREINGRPTVQTRKKFRRFLTRWRMEKTSREIWQEIFEAGALLKKRLLEDIASAKEALDLTILRNRGHKWIAN